MGLNNVISSLRGEYVTVENKIKSAANKGCCTQENMSIASWAGELAEIEGAIRILLKLRAKIEEEKLIRETETRDERYKFRR